MINIQLAHQKEIESILRENFPNGCAWYFGSRVLGTSSPYSDIDIVLANQNKTPVSLLELAKLRMAFEESNIPCKVDLTDWNSINQAFRDNIDKDRVLIKF